jgi:hypothetical protein
VSGNATARIGQDATLRRVVQPTLATEAVLSYVLAAFAFPPNPPVLQGMARRM